MTVGTVVRITRNGKVGTITHDYGDGTFYVSFGAGVLNMPGWSEGMFYSTQELELAPGSEGTAPQ